MYEKRMASFVLCVLLVLSLAGCGEKTGDVPKDGFATKAEEIVTEAEEITTKAEEIVTETEEIIIEAEDDITEAEEAFTGTESYFETEKKSEQTAEQKGILSSAQDIELENPGEDGKNYTFIYAGEEFQAIYTPDNWKIIDSWRITKEPDITIICQALQEEHPIHGADGSTYRTPEDMAFEWIQHNLAYELLPEDNPWRENAKDVDLNPEDQGKTCEEMYEDRISHSAPR